MIGQNFKIIASQSHILKEASRGTLGYSTLPHSNFSFFVRFLIKIWKFIFFKKRRGYFLRYLVNINMGNIQKKNSNIIFTKLSGKRNYKEF